MFILLDVTEAAERFDELIDRVLCGEEFVICRDGIPIAELTAIPNSEGTMDDVLALATEGLKTVPAGSTSSHELYDEHGLPR